MMKRSSSDGPAWYRYLRFWRRDIQGDIDAELRFHFDARIEELTGQGASPEAARTRALDEFGDVHDVRGRLREIDDRVARRRDRAEVFDVLRQDVAYAVRALRRTPAVSLTIIITLALGLGVNAAMFSLLDVVFLRPPAGVVHADGIRRVWSKHHFSNSTEFWLGYDYRGYAAVAASVGDLADVAAYEGTRKAAISTGENPPTAEVSRANSGYFRLLGLRPLIGRFYTPQEDALDGPQPVAVVSEAFWRRRFGADASVLGQTITIGDPRYPAEDVRYTIIGVAPSRFTGVDLNATDVWLPLGSGMPLGSGRGRWSVPWYQDPNINGFQILLRPRPDVNERQIEHRLTVALRGPNIGYRQDTATVAQLGSIVAANGPGEISAEVQVATRLGAVAIIVLVIACANVVNLLLARASRRQREIAVRLALGISRGRLVRMLVTESTLLAFVAAAASLLAAYWGGTALRNLLMPEVIWAESPLQWRVFVFALAGAIAAGLLAGLVPALHARSPDLTNALKAGARDGGVQRSRLRSFLIVVQAALSVLLLVGAGLFIKSLNNAREKDIGYTVDRLMFVELENFKLDTARQRAQSDRLLELEPRLASVPGVEAVAYASMRPTWGMQFLRGYYPDADTIAHKKPEGVYSAVTPGFFAATGTRLLRGRTFPSGRSAANEPYGVVVNEAMADALWPGENPLGKCVRFNKPTEQCTTVIGVAQTAILNSVTEKPSPHFYFSMEHMPVQGWGVGAVVLRVPTDRMSGVAADVRALLRTEFPEVYSKTVTMAQAMERDYRPWRLGAIVFSLFGMLALIVAAVGVYSTVSYAVSQRTHEFGVRVALGAQMGDVLRHVVGEGVRVVTIGVVAGVLMALAAGRLVATLLYGVAPTDPVAMIGSAVVLLVTAIVASLAPAWRAAKADPVTALRAE